MSEFAMIVRAELIAARAKNAPMNSAHHAYAVILEEVEEFWEEVKKKREYRSKQKMLMELVQIGAMAQRAAEDLGLAKSEKFPDDMQASQR